MVYAAPEGATGDDQRQTRCLPRHGVGQRSVVLVDGVPMSLSDVSHLARRLQEDGHTELAMRVGLAVDTNRRILPLNLEDRELILMSLDGCPNALTPLRAKLMTGSTPRPDGRDRRVSVDRRPASFSIRPPSNENGASTTLAPFLD